MGHVSKHIVKQPSAMIMEPILNVCVAVSEDQGRYPGTKPKLNCGCKQSQGCRNMIAPNLSISQVVCFRNIRVDPT